MADNTAEGSQKSRLADLEGGQHELDVFDQGLPWSLAQASDARYQAGERAQPDTSVRVSGPSSSTTRPAELLMLHILFTASC